MVQGFFVLAFILSILAAVRVFLRSRSDIALEILALRQQVAVLKRKRRLSDEYQSGSRLMHRD
jgi:hypothetical protein